MAQAKVNRGILACWLLATGLFVAWVIWTLLSGSAVYQLIVELPFILGGVGVSLLLAGLLVRGAGGVGIAVVALVLVAAGIVVLKAPLRSAEDDWRYGLVPTDALVDQIEIEGSNAAEDAWNELWTRDLSLGQMARISARVVKGDGDDDDSASASSLRERISEQWGELTGDRD
jgi:hypothetical protein